MGRLGVRREPIIVWGRPWKARVAVAKMHRSGWTRILVNPRIAEVVGKVIVIQVYLRFQSIAGSSTAAITAMVKAARSSLGS